MAGCVSEEKPPIPERAKEQKNLTIYTADTVPEMQINVDQDKSFGSNNDILIGGMGNIAVDHRNRVFIADGEKLNIHVFDSTGNYVTKIGREGSGPGEFRMIGNLSTDRKFLFTYDALQRRVNIFSLDSLSLSQTINLNSVDIDRIPTLNGYFFPSIVRFIGKCQYLVGFSKPIYTDRSDPRYNLNNQFRNFYSMDGTGRVKAGRVLKQKDYSSLTATVGGEFRYTQFGFLGRPLLAISKENNLYSARTNDFLIEVRDLTGKYLRAFYYQLEKQSLSRKEVIRRQNKEYPSVIEYRSSIIRHAADEDIPNTWPVLDDMLIDDQNRLWVSVVMNDLNHRKWWVLDKSGKLLARFKWHQKKEIEIIKNGKLYVRQTSEKGLDRIVRYDITMRNSK